MVTCQSRVQRLRSCLKLVAQASSLRSTASHGVTSPRKDASDGRQDACPTGFFKHVLKFKGRRVACLAITALLSAASLDARELSEYKIGDRVEEDISTLTTLVVIDPEATAVLKEKEGERVPVIFRFHPKAADEAVTALHENFVSMRSNFLNAIEQNFGERELTADSIASSKFTRFVTTFQRQNPGFPLTTALATAWATGEPDDSFEKPLLSALGDQMKLFVRATNAVASGAKVGGTVRLVWCDDGEAITEQMVARHGTNFSKNDFISFQRARTDLQNSFAPEQRAEARYVTSFLRPNCSVEEELTVAMRSKRAEGITAADTYSPGQIIAKRGQVIDNKTIVALDALKEKLAAERLHQIAVNASAKPPVAGKSNWLLLAAIGGGCLIFASVLAILWRRKTSTSMLPAPIESALESTLSAEEKLWRERALAAERRADKAQAVIRKGLIAHLAGWMSDQLVQKLLLQRAHLIDAQEKAVMEVDRLGQRLDTIQSRLQDRLLTYERKITDLEKELDTKDEINRELIKAEIQTIRKQMDAERAKSEGGLN
jgi:hypothetical protein